MDTQSLIEQAWAEEKKPKATAKPQPEPVAATAAVPSMASSAVDMLKRGLLGAPGEAAAQATEGFGFPGAAQKIRSVNSLLDMTPVSNYIMQHPEVALMPIGGAGAAGVATKLASGPLTNFLYPFLGGIIGTEAGRAAAEPVKAAQGLPAKSASEMLQELPSNLASDAYWQTGASIGQSVTNRVLNYAADKLQAPAAEATDRLLRGLGVRKPTTGTLATTEPIAAGGPTGVTMVQPPPESALTRVERTAATVFGGGPLAKQWDAQAQDLTNRAAQIVKDAKPSTPIGVAGRDVVSKAAQAAVDKVGAEYNTALSNMNRMLRADYGAPTPQDAAHLDAAIGSRIKSPAYAAQGGTFQENAPRLAPKQDRRIPGVAAKLGAEPSPEFTNLKEYFADTPGDFSAFKKAMAAVPGGPEALAQFEAKGTMPMGFAQNIRGVIGAKAEEAGLSKGALSAVFGHVDDDLMNFYKGALVTSPAGAAQETTHPIFQRYLQARDQYKAVQSLKEDLNGLFADKTPDEALAWLATKLTKDTTRTAAAQDMLPAAVQPYVREAILNKMGNAPGGDAPIQLEPFLERFMKLPGEVKHFLLPGGGAATMEQIKSAMDLSLRARPSAHANISANNAMLGALGGNPSMLESIPLIAFNVSQLGRLLESDAVQKAVKYGATLPPYASNGAVVTLTRLGQAADTILRSKTAPSEQKQAAAILKKNVDSIRGAQQ